MDLAALVTLLGKMGVDSVLAEGGAQLHWGLVQAGLVNRVQAYLAPKLLGGQGAKSPVGGQGFPHPDQALSLSSPTLTRLGEDILLESEVTG
ncbi:MAG: RibD family protein [Evtepia gabavorous]